MGNLSQIEKLDFILTLFKENESNGIAINELQLWIKEKDIDISDIELGRAIGQLSMDNYIQMVGVKHIIRIEGILFEGYEQRIINKAAENTRLENLENSQKASRNQMNFLTGIIAIGTLVASMYYLYLLIQDLCNCEFWFQK